MRKIPTLFKREFEGHKVVKIFPEVTPGFEWVLENEGSATIKVDGACCCIAAGEFYKRYDAKNGKPIPDGAIKCQNEPDPITGHMPCWVKCDRNNPADKWFWVAYDDATKDYPLPDGTYEAVGLHFNGNPYNLDRDILIKHAQSIITVKRSFEGIKEWLMSHKEEGLVFWKDGVAQCKIKRSDFGFEWPLKDNNAAG